MSNIHYINTQDIRKDLVGFLRNLENGEEVAVLNRSKVIARLNRPVVAHEDAHGVKHLLDAADEIQRTTAKKAGGLGPTESYKKRYFRNMAKKYGIS